MDIDEKMNLVARSPTEEVVTSQDLRRVFETNSHPTHYVGLEISGLLHLGSLILTGFKINDFIKAGVRCKVFLADWHSYINDKFGGDWEKIKKAAKYYEEAFKFFCPGVEVVTGSDIYAETGDYWENMVRFSKNITLSRNVRCLTIMGRSERDRLHFAQYLYPPMQAVDIKALDLDIVHAGMDQRKVHMLVREVFPKMRWKVPVAVHHHLLPGLAGPVRFGLDEDFKADTVISSKMSKSKPWTCIFVHDSEEEVRAKLKKAWCPEGLVENNPILEMVRYISFYESGEFMVDRSSRFGGPLSFKEYRELEEVYRAKKLHPADLKQAVADSVNRVIQPIRKHFESLADLLKVYEEEE
ncbi:MAG: tyrosine--tRNA ligase [Nitrososphaerales archaeon]